MVRELGAVVECEWAPREVSRIRAKFRGKRLPIEPRRVQSMPMVGPFRVRFQAPPELRSHVERDASGVKPTPDGRRG